MDRNDQQAIQQLFGKLAAVEQQSPPRDGEAESFIRQQIAEQPGAPYYMAQTIVVQEQALQAAQARIEELEAQAAEAPRPAGGLFGSLFGGSAPPARRASVPRIGSRGPAGYGAAAPQAGGPAAMQQPQRGGGFLAGAAQTAMGVAGGMLLANAIGGMLGGTGEAQAAEVEPEMDAPMDDGGGFDDFEF